MTELGLVSLEFNHQADPTGYFWSSVEKKVKKSDLSLFISSCRCRRRCRRCRCCLDLLLLFLLSPSFLSSTSTSLTPFALGFFFLLYIFNNYSLIFSFFIGPFVLQRYYIRYFFYLHLETEI